MYHGSFKRPLLYALLVVHGVMLTCEMAGVFRHYYSDEYREPLVWKSTAWSPWQHGVASRFIQPAMQRSYVRMCFIWTEVDNENIAVSLPGKRLVGYERQERDWLWYHAERVRKVDDGEQYLKMINRSTITAFN